MRIRTILILLAAIAGLPPLATAQEPFRVVVKAYEAELGSMRLPGNVNGTLSFKPCSECEYKTVRVSSDTRYEADGELYGLEDFRQVVEALGIRSKTAVTVKHHLQSDLITAVKVQSY